MLAQAAALVNCRVFFEAEGILPAPESGHAIAAVISETCRARDTGRKKTIVFCLSGSGYLDLEGYASVFDLQRTPEYALAN